MKNRYLNTILDIIFPGKCLLCGKDLLFSNRPGYSVCMSCLDSLEQISTFKRCKICSMPLISENDICTRCRERKFHFNTNFSLFEYYGPIKELIIQYKSKNRKRAANILASFLACRLKKLLNPIIIPVPARKSVKRKRGWDHIERICRILSRDYGFKTFRLLKRKGNIPQKILDYNQRVLNIEGAINIKKNIRCGAERVVLIDDVFTTGSTVSECARVLKIAGIKGVDVLTLAID